MGATNRAESIDADFRELIGQEGPDGTIGQNAPTARVGSVSPEDQQGFSTAPDAAVQGPITPVEASVPPSQSASVPEPKRTAGRTGTVQWKINILGEIKLAAVERARSSHMGHAEYLESLIEKDLAGDPVDAPLAATSIIAGSIRDRAEAIRDLRRELTRAVAAISRMTDDVKEPLVAAAESAMYRIDDHVLSDQQLEAAACYLASLPWAQNDH